MMITEERRRLRRTRGTRPTASRCRSTTRRPRRAAPRRARARCRIASRTPADIAAGALDSWISRPAQRPAPSPAQRSSVRSIWVGTSVNASASAITMTPKIAGTTVIAKSPSPAKTPSYSAEADQHERRACRRRRAARRNATVSTATTRAGIPLRRSAQAVSAAPPAPPAANSRVAASPAIVIW